MRFGQVQFEKDTFGGGESLLGIVWNGIPDSDVGDVNGTEEIGRRTGLDSP